MISRRDAEEEKKETLARRMLSPAPQRLPVLQTQTSLSGRICFCSVRSLRNLSMTLRHLLAEFCVVSRRLLSPLAG